MANFQRNGENVHGKTLSAVFGQPFEIELWGPLDIYVTPPKELAVTLAMPNPGVTIKQGDMIPSKNARVWKITGLPIGPTTLQAKNGAGAVWSVVTVDTKAGSPVVVTKDQLKDKTGVVQAKWPPSPAIVALISLLTKGTDGALKAGIGLLESAGRAGNLYEHTAGLALDIFRDANKPAQRLQAHNLIRFLIANRKAMGWRNMFYENWGFGASARMGGSPNHFNHIHIDWMDFATLKFDGPNKLDRSKWTEITWPVEARSGSAIENDANFAAVRAAWNDASSELLTDSAIDELYKK